MTLQELEATALAFNKAYPVGTRGALRKDSGEVIVTHVINPFTILSNHTVVGWFDGVSGCYLASRFVGD